MIKRGKGKYAQKTLREEEIKETQQDPPMEKMKKEKLKQ